MSCRKSQDLCTRSTAKWWVLFSQQSFFRPEIAFYLLSLIFCMKAGLSSQFRVKKILDKNDIAKVKDDEINRKIFLGGLNKATTEARLEKYFGKLGEIEDILINRNIGDGTSRGCGFLLFKDREVARNLLAQNRLHFIDGSYVEVKQCYEKSKSKALKEEKKMEMAFESLQNLPQNNSAFVGTILQDQNYIQMMNQMMSLFFQGQSASPSDQSQPEICYSERMMQSDSFVDSLNSNHGWMKSCRDNSLAVPSLNFQNCPIFNIGKQMNQSSKAESKAVGQQSYYQRPEKNISTCPFRSTIKIGE